MQGSRRPRLSIPRGERGKTGASGSPLSQLRAEGAAWEHPPAASQLQQLCPHQQTWLLRHSLASSQMEKSLCSQLCSASLAEQGCLGAL